MFDAEISRVVCGFQGICSMIGWWLVFYNHFCAQAEQPTKVMKWSQKWNNLQLGPHQDSNKGGSDLRSNTLPLDHGGPLLSIGTVTNDVTDIIPDD